MDRTKRLSMKEELIDSLIGSGNTFRGAFKLCGALRVDGIIEGEVVTNSRLHISKLGRGKGKVRAKSIEIGGEFEGDLEATNNVVIKSSAFVNANITASFLTIEDGAFYSGQCSINPDNLDKMLDNAEKEADFLLEENESLITTK